MVILASSGKKGECFVETKNLDGETNLKMKKGTEKLSHLSLCNESQLSNEQIQVDYERPNSYIYKFNGSIRTNQDSKTIPLDNNNFVLRGCSLKNTGYINYKIKLQLQT